VGAVARLNHLPVSATLYASAPPVETPAEAEQVSMISKLAPLAMCAVLSVGATSVHAFALNRIAFEFGTEEDDSTIDRYGGLLSVDWGVNWFAVGDWYLGGYFEAGVSYWDSEPGSTGNDSLVDFHVTPVFRWQRSVDTGFAPFIEAGVGPHGYTESAIEDKDFTLEFAFGSHVGAGLRFGDQGRFEVMYRFQHQSNADLGDDNPGIDFHLVQIGYHF
jgi:lipid A 3-O-deacylase